MSATAVMAAWATPVVQQANGTPERFLERKRESMARGSQSMGVTLSDLNMQAQAWAGWNTRGRRTEPRRPEPSGRGIVGGRGDDRLADTSSQHLRGGSGAGDGAAGKAEGEAREWQRSGHDNCAGGADDRLADANNGQRDRIADGQGRERDRAQTGRVESDSQLERRSATDRPSPTNGHWRDADWLFCRDGKWRPVEPGTFPLAHGLPARVGRLRGYGNAIVPQVAAEIIKTVIDQ
jgi:hypothetical protein